MNDSPHDPDTRDPSWDLGLSLTWILRVLGPGLLLTLLSPIAHKGGHAVFLFDLLGEATAAELVGAAAPLVGGLLLVALTFVRRLDRGRLAVATVVVSILALILTGLNAESYRSVLAMGASALRRQPYPVVAAMVLFGGAGLMSSRRGPRTGVRAAVLGGWIAVGTFLALPQRGTPLIWHIVSGVVGGVSRGDPVFAAVVLGGTLVTVAPALVGILAIPLWTGRPRWGRPVAWVSAATLPGLALVMGAQLIMHGGGAESLLVTSRAVILLTAATLPLIVALGNLGEKSAEASGLRLGSWIPIGTVTTVCLFAVVWVVTEVPTKGVVDWTLGPPSRQADRLFERALPEYVVARADRDDALTEGRGSAQAASRLRDKAAALRTTAAGLDPQLRDAVEAFVEASDPVDLPGPRWTREVMAINAAVRRAALPYYVDPDMWEQGDATRLLYIKTFRVAQVSRVIAADRLYAAIHVWRLDHVNIDSSLLGLSRDAQPFAMVLLDEVQAYLARSLPLLFADPPLCRELEESAASWRHALNEECGRRVAAAVWANSDTWSEPERRHLREVADLLGVRTDAWRGLRRALATRGHELAVPETLVFTGNALNPLGWWSEGPEEKALAGAIVTANEAIERSGTASFVRLRQILVTTTERHEIQHQIDGPHLVAPRRLFRMLPGYSDAAVARAGRELSGYLAEFDLDDIGAQLALAHLLDFLTTPRLHDSPEFFAAAVVMESLSGLSVTDGQGNLRPRTLRRAYRRVSDMPTDVRRRTLRASYRQLFGADLPTIHRAPDPNPPSRLRRSRDGAGISEKVP